VKEFLNNVAVLAECPRNGGKEWYTEYIFGAIAEAYLPS
jgi:hypothetical protein